MTQQEYEQQKRECWEEFWDEISGNIDFTPGVDNRMKEHIYDTFDRAYALGKQETKQETDSEDTVISGWAARHGNGPNVLELRIYTVKPKRMEVLRIWDGHGEKSVLIDHRFFPDLTWEDDPIESEIILKRKKKNL